MKAKIICKTHKHEVSVPVEERYGQYITAEMNFLKKYRILCQDDERNCDKVIMIDGEEYIENYWPSKNLCCNISDTRDMLFFIKKISRDEHIENMNSQDEIREKISGGK